MPAGGSPSRDDRSVMMEIVVLIHVVATGCQEGEAQAVNGQVASAKELHYQHLGLLRSSWILAIPDQGGFHCEERCALVRVGESVILGDEVAQRRNLREKCWVGLLKVERPDGSRQGTDDLSPVFEA